MAQALNARSRPDVLMVREVGGTVNGYTQEAIGEGKFLVKGTPGREVLACRPRQGSGDHRAR